MNHNKIFIITPSYNTINDLTRLYNHLLSFDKNKFMWIVIDGQSSDGTQNFFQNNLSNWIIFKSEKDYGIYDAINKAIENFINLNDFYCVSGSDDLPNIDNLFKSINDSKSDIILGQVEYPLKKIKQPRFILNNHSKCSMSFHSVGTIIKKTVHIEIGSYSTKFITVSDELFFQKALRNPNIIISTSTLNFGFYSNSGLSAREYVLVTLEMFYIRSLFYNLTFVDLISLFLKLCKYKILK
jgi:glycosyltransferase involved in cell wall biosynthesis